MNKKEFEEVWNFYDDMRQALARASVSIEDEEPPIEAYEILKLALLKSEAFYSWLMDVYREI